MKENELLNVLKEHGQEHIFEAYQKLDDKGKEKLAAQIERIDWSIVEMAGHKELSQERGKLEPLSALEVTQIEENEGNLYLRASDQKFDGCDGQGRLFCAAVCHDQRQKS